MIPSSPVHARRAASLVFAFVLSLVALGMGASAASAATTTVKKVFGGPLADGAGIGACNPDATAAKTDASQFTDFCVAFRTYSDEANRLANTPEDVDLKSQVIDTPRGFAGIADAYPQCTDAQFNKASENDAACAANTQMGEVSADIRAKITEANPIVRGLLFAGLSVAQQSEGGNAKLTAPGKVFNLAHSENEVARLGIDLNPNGGGFDQPNVKIIVRVTLRPSPDVGLRSLIDDMPNKAHVAVGALGIDEVDELSIDQFSLLFYGPQRGSMPRPFGFLGSDCSTDQETRLRASAYDGTPSGADAKTYRLTDCGDANIPFTPSVAFSTSENRPDVTAETVVSVKFGNSTNAAYQAAGPKKTVVTLPDGLSFSGQIASGAAGLPLCTPAQYGQFRAEAGNCPAATAVGTVSFKSPVQSRLLTGKVFLGSQPEPGALPDIYIEAAEGPAADAPRVKLVGKLTIDSRNRIVTTLDDLPEVPVNEFLLTFRGGDQAAVVTPPTCGTFQGGLDASPFNRPTTPSSSTADYTVNADCDAVGAFTPGVSFALDSPAAGKSSPFTTTVTRPDRTQRLGRTQIELPAGMLATLKGVPECSTADATAGTCPAATKVGTVNSLAGVGPAPYQAPGEVFLTQRGEGAVAGLVFRVPIKFGDVDLGTLNVPARVEIRAEDLGLRVLADVPERYKGIPLNIRSLAIRLDRTGFPLSPTNCGPLNTVSKITALGGATTVDVGAGLQVNACDQLKFTPQIDAAVNGSTGANGRPTVQVRIQNPAGNSALRQTYVTLPEGLGFDLKQTARACSLEDFKATKCPDVAKIGKVTGALAIADEPLSGDLYLLKPSGGLPLPGLGLAFRGRFNGNVAGTNAIAKSGQLITQFETLPDLPLTTFQIDVTGGTNSVLISTAKLCSNPSVDTTVKFVAHSGPTVNGKSSTFCGGKLGALVPKITAKISGVRKGRPALALGFTAPLGTAGTAMKVKQVDVSLPSGYSLSTSRAKSSKGLAVKSLSIKGKSTSKRISTRKLRVKLPKAGTTKGKILSRTGTILIKSSKTRKSKAKVAITLTFVYTNGQKTSVPIRLTAR